MYSCMRRATWTGQKWMKVRYLHVLRQDDDEHSFHFTFSTKMNLA